MKVIRGILSCALLTAVWAGQPIQNLQVTLRGKKYDVSGVETVQDLQKQIEEASGIDSKQQGRVLFGGKRLSASDILADCGVSDGAHLNMVPGKAKTSKKSSSAASAAAASAGAAPPATGGGGLPNMEELMKSSGLDTGKIDELMKSMGGAGGGDGKTPDMKESLEMMQSMMQSPLFTEYMSNPERLEESRQMILQNPMLKSLMAGMPGMDELLNDPVAWREAMQAASNLYQNMDTNDLMNSMMGGMGGAGAGLFDGTMDGTTAALDELSEGE